MKGYFPLLEIDKIIRVAGAERVDEKASIKLREILEDSAKELVSRAIVYAKHAGRKNIDRRDVMLAAESLLSQQRV